jgi:hypothetical protein
MAFVGARSTAVCATGSTAAGDLERHGHVMTGQVGRRFAAGGSPRNLYPCRDGPSYRNGVQFRSAGQHRSAAPTRTSPSCNAIANAMGATVGDIGRLCTTWHLAVFRIRKQSASARDTGRHGCLTVHIRALLRVRLVAAEAHI